MILDHRWSDHNRIECFVGQCRNPLVCTTKGDKSPIRSKDQFHEVSFLQGQKPNPDWGIAWGTGRTNNPSLYNVKYRANHILYPKDITAEPFSSTHAVQNPISSEHHRAKSRWWSQTGSNRRPPECKSGALPAELWPHFRDRDASFASEERAGERFRRPSEEQRRA